MSDHEAPEQTTDPNKLVDVQTIRSGNGERLKGRVFMGEFIFNRAVLTDLSELVESAKSGDRPANDVIAFINPHSKFSLPDSVSHFGLGWTIHEELRMLESLAGYDRDIAMPLYHKVYAAYENILSAAGLPNPNIRKKNDLGVMENIPFPPSLGLNNDPVEVYIQEVNKLFDYHEHLFSPEDVIRYCERRKEIPQKYLDGGVDVRRNQTLTDREIRREEKRIAGYEEAIKRNQTRLSPQNI